MHGMFGPQGDDDLVHHSRSLCGLLNGNIGKYIPLSMILIS